MYFKIMTKKKKHRPRPVNLSPQTMERLYEMRNRPMIQIATLFAKIFSEAMLGPNPDAPPEVPQCAHCQKEVPLVMCEDCKKNLGI